MATYWSSDGRLHAAEHLDHLEALALLLSGGQLLGPQAARQRDLADLLLRIAASGGRLIVLLPDGLRDPSRKGPVALAEASAQVRERVRALLASLATASVDLSEARIEIA